MNAKQKLLLGRVLFIAIAICIIACCHVFTKSAERSIEKTTQEDSIATETTATDSQDSIDNSITSELKTVLSNSGMNIETFKGTQLILAEATESAAKLLLYENVDGQWLQIGDTFYGWVGKNGVSDKKVEGDGTTPCGIFPLSYSFGLESPPTTKMDYIQVTNESYWVDDVNSKYYNQWVEGTAVKDWNSAEHLSDYTTQYALGIVIEYNTTPITLGLGSAIFLHCGNRPTSGCVSVSHEDMVEILNWLDPAKSPSIAICSA